MNEFLAHNASYGFVAFESAADAEVREIPLRFLFDCCFGLVSEETSEWNSSS